MTVKVSKDMLIVCDVYGWVSGSVGGWKSLCEHVPEHMHT